MLTSNLNFFLVIINGEVSSIFLFVVAINFSFCASTNLAEILLILCKSTSRLLHLVSAFWRYAYFHRDKLWRSI